MSVAKTLVSALTAASVVVGSLASLSSAASANDDRHNGYGNTYGNSSYGEPRVNRWRDFDRHPSNYEYRHDGDEGHQYRHRDHTGRNVALGVFATVLGLAIAAESSRVGHQYYGERD